MRLRGSVIDVFHRGRRSPAISAARPRAAPLRSGNTSPGRTSAPASKTPAPAGAEGPGYRPPCPRLRHRDHGAQPQPEFGFPLLLRRSPAGRRPRAGTPRRRLPLCPGTRHPNLARSRQHPAHRARSRCRRAGARDHADRSSQHPRTGGLQMTDNAVSHPLAQRIASLRLPGMLAAFLEQMRATISATCVRGPARAADRPRDIRTPIQGPPAAPQEGSAAPTRTPASRISI